MIQSAILYLALVALFAAAHYLGVGVVIGLGRIFPRAGFPKSLDDLND